MVMLEIFGLIEIDRITPEWVANPTLRGVYLVPLFSMRPISEASSQR